MGQNMQNMQNMQFVPQPIMQYGQYGQQQPMMQYGQFAQQPMQFAQQPMQFAQQPMQFAQQPMQFAQQPMQFAQQPMQFAQQQPLIQRPNMNLNFNEIIANEDPIEAPIAPPIVANKKRKANYVANDVVNDIVNDVVVNDVNNFENLFNNVNLETHKKQKRDIEFLQEKDGSNIIKTIAPSDVNSANFNSKKNPNEKYMITFLNGKTEELKAVDINDYALETSKVVYEHNKTIRQSNGYSAIYVRCSNCNDVSVETQLKKCLDYAKTHSLILTGYFCDNGYSGRHGKNLKNGELSFWTQYLQDNTNLIVYSVDRLTRHLLSGIQYLDLLALRNISTHFVTNQLIYNSQISAMHKCMVQQELQSAEKYSNDISEKTKGTIRRLREEGHAIGMAPYGYKNVLVNGIRKRQINNIETETISKIKAKYFDIIENRDNYKNDFIRNSYSSIYKYIIRWCKRSGMKNRNNTAFTESFIKKIVA